MTLIITHINRHGIVHASDSNLTGENKQSAGEAKKTFEIPYLKAGLTIAGSYAVGTDRMNIWMSKFIQKQKQIPEVSLSKFSHNLKNALNSEMTKEQKKRGSMIHIAGYVEEEGLSHPEFWFVRNIHKINLQTGQYEDFREDFDIAEDFWARDYQAIKNGFDDPTYFTRQIYVNGFTPGRISFNVLQKELEKFFKSIWSVKEWEFRAPMDIEETELLIRNYMDTINILFRLSDYPAKYIGGQTQSLKIKRPENHI